MSIYKIVPIYNIQWKTVLLDTSRRRHRDKWILELKIDFNDVQNDKRRFFFMYLYLHRVEDGLPHGIQALFGPLCILQGHKNLPANLLKLAGYHLPRSTKSCMFKLRGVCKLSSQLVKVVEFINSSKTQWLSLGVFRAIQHLKSKSCILVTSPRGVSGCPIFGTSHLVALYLLGGKCPGEVILTACSTKQNLYT